MVISEVIAKGRPASPVKSASVPLPNHFRYLHRAFIEPRRSPGIELTAFVRAPTPRLAIHRIAIVIAALEDGGTAESVSERIYNCVSAAECIEEGMSEDPELRISSSSRIRGSAEGCARAARTLPGRSERRR
jgi:hypothetical protein